MRSIQTASSATLNDSYACMCVCVCVYKKHQKCIIHNCVYCTQMTALNIVFVGVCVCVCGIKNTSDNINTVNIRKCKH